METNSLLHGGNAGRIANVSRGVVAVLIALGLLGFLLAAGLGCNRRSAENHLSTGDLAMRDGKLADAESEYKAAAEVAPNDPRTHLALAGLYVYEKKPAMAQEERIKALELDPNNALAHASVAADYVNESQFPIAEEQYRAAIALNPALPKYHLELGSVLVSENNPAGAEAEMRTAIGLDPANAQAHFRLANLLVSESGREQDAQSEYQEARALDPALATPNAPAVAPAPTLSSASAAPMLKPVDKSFRLTKNSPVYAQPEQASAVVAQVRRQKFVKVTGIEGDWLRIKLRSGTVGFIPVSAAE